MKTVNKLLLAALFFVSGTTLSFAQTTEKVDPEEIMTYLKDCGAFYLATVNQDQPRVRPFGAVEVINGKLYLVTGKAKNVFKQLVANPKFEICGLKKSGSEWIRISVKLMNDEDTKVKQEMLDKNPGLKNRYSATDNNMAVLYIEDGTATLNSFSGETKTVRF